MAHFDVSVMHAVMRSSNEQEFVWSVASDKSWMVSLSALFFTVFARMSERGRASSKGFKGFKPKGVVKTSL